MHPNDELLEYLKSDVAKLRIANELSRKKANHNRWALLVLFVLYFLTCLAFCGAIVHTTQEHTKQIFSILGTDIETVTTKETTEYRIEADSQGGGGDASASFNCVGDNSASVQVIKNKE